MANQNIEQKDAVLIDIKGKLESLSQLSSECCIYRVRERIREINSKAYTPQLVSIGPFHHGKEHLRVMEEHKLRYLKSLLNRTERGLEYYFEVIKTWEEKARNFYAETIELNSDNFVKMMLVDGSFIVECLLRCRFRELVDESDRLFNKPWLLSLVVEDMILLENQLPFFVLEGLFNLVFLHYHIEDEIPSFLELVNGFFMYNGIMDELPLLVSNPRIQHFVDFIRYSYLESFIQVVRQENKIYCCPPSVTQLHEAGIKFKTKTSCSLFDINFTNGILEILQLKIYGTTEMLLRNLLAFEESHCEDRYIIQYMMLLKYMIKTSKDVDLLFHHKIITGLTDREKTLRMFEKIVSQVYAGQNFYFTSLSENLNAYCMTPWNKWKATLKRDYYNTIFNTPWKILSLSLALVILLLTIIQALFYHILVGFSWLV